MGKHRETCEFGVFGKSRVRDWGNTDRLGIGKHRMVIGETQREETLKFAANKFDLKNGVPETSK